MAGQGTLGVELAEQVPDLDTVVVAVGGVVGWLLGSGSHSPSVTIVTVETEACNSFHAAHTAGEPTTVSPAGVAADALGAKQIGTLPGTFFRDELTQSLVDDEATMAARRALWTEMQLAVEPAAATAVAAPELAPTCQRQTNGSPSSSVAVSLIRATSAPVPTSPDRSCKGSPLVRAWAIPFPPRGAGDIELTSDRGDGQWNWRGWSQAAQGHTRRGTAPLGAAAATC